MKYFFHNLFNRVRFFLRLHHTRIIRNEFGHDISYRPNKKTGTGQYYHRMPDGTKVTILTSPGISDQVTTVPTTDWLK